jgi:hypothetical protein
MKKYNGTSFSRVQQEYENTVLYPQSLIRKDDPASEKPEHDFIIEFANIMEKATVPNTDGFVVDFLFSYPGPA